MIRAVAIMLVLGALLLGWTAALWNVSSVFAVRRPYGISDSEIAGGLFRELGGGKDWQIQIYVPWEPTESREVFLKELVEREGPLNPLIAGHVDLILTTIPLDLKYLQQKGLVRIWSGDDFVAEIVFPLDQLYLSQALSLKISESIREFRKGEKNG